MIIPAGHRVLIKPDEVETKSEGGIILAIDEKAERNGQVYGTVIAIGKNAWKAFDDGHAWAEVGDKVAYTRYGGKPIKDPDTGEQLLIVNDEDITAVIKGNRDE